jgi:hypothetical protein
MGLGRYIKGTAYRRGVVGSRKGWFWFWIVLATVGWLRRHTGRGEDRVLRFEILPGERYVVTHEPPVPKTRRRDRKPAG